MSVAVDGNDTVPTSLWLATSISSSESSEITSALASFRAVAALRHEEATASSLYDR